MSVEVAIRTKLVAAFAPVHLEVLNESSNHRVPPGSESHFKVVLVTAAFEGDRLIARHRRVNAALAAELAGGVHALALHTYRPALCLERLSTNAAGQVGSSRSELLS